MGKRCRLSAMMALVYAVQGSFWPLLAIHLADGGMSALDRSGIFATLAIGSAAAPLGAGQLVDRWAQAQYVLAGIYAIGALMLAALASGWAGSWLALFALFLVYWALTAPAYALCNVVAMRHLDDPRREFGGVRLWGTAGWMIAGWVVSLVMVANGGGRAGHGAFEALWVATAVSAATGLYCLTLPRTPPLAVGPRWAGSARETFELAARRDVRVLLTAAFGIYLTMPFLYQALPAYMEARGLRRGWIGLAMSLGQASEIAALAALPWLMRRLGLKSTLALGALAWCARFLGLTLGPPLWLIVAGGLAHGVGIACFTVGAQVAIDQQAPPHLRATVQALLLMVSSGAGAFLGSLIVGGAVGRFGAGDDLVFLLPCVIDGALILYLLRGFRAPASVAPLAGAPSVERPAPRSIGRGSPAHAGHLVTESADG